MHDLVDRLNFIVHYGSEILHNGSISRQSSGNLIEIRGLCTFFVKEYESYNGRNPKSGESVNVAPKKLPFFKCGRELKERVDY